jgi:RNA binding exosome subunit
MRTMVKTFYIDFSFACFTEEVVEKLDERINTFIGTRYTLIDVKPDMNTGKGLCRTILYTSD